jgi:hydrogenase expression/formation protein HypE
LINECFLRHFANPILARMDDAALLDLRGPLAMSTDAYIVTPLFFPGGGIGTLAVHGTVNDVAMMGARPRYLSCAFILEEGLDMDVLERVVRDMAAAAKEADVLIVAGDTKVAPRGVCDKIFIVTTGAGETLVDPAPSAGRARPGDAVLISGTMGDHGLTIMAQRESLSFASDARSDSAPLNHMAEALVRLGDVHTLRDPTRGGLATALNEIAAQSGCAFSIREADIPVRENIRSACAILGLDPLYLANEGKLICILPESKAEAALAVMRACPYGKDAARIGAALEPDATLRAGQVVLETPIGGRRLLSMLEGDPLPRIC